MGKVTAAAAAVAVAAAVATAAVALVGVAMDLAAVEALVVRVAGWADTTVQGEGWEAAAASEAAVALVKAEGVGVGPLAA